MVLCSPYLNPKQYDRLPINVLFQNIFHIWDHHGKDSLGKHTSFADINLRDGVAKSWCVCVYVHVFAYVRLRREIGPRLIKKLIALQKLARVRLRETTRNVDFHKRQYISIPTLHSDLYRLG